MACYRNGGCGPYENRSCSECPASKPEYARRESEYEACRRLRAEAATLDEERKRAYDECANKTNPPIKIKVFLNEDGISCVMKDANLPVEIEIIDEAAVQHSAQYCDDLDANADEHIDAYINQLCGDGFVYVEDENIIVTNNL